ncbi:MAG: GntP family permease [Candidatus Omnitrophota bacterium]|jgi:GntP family gluconate:H+ symporter|nr:MAG: GntP family permease [Candidatus Omnitrophota bacterium]
MFGPLVCLIVGVGLILFLILYLRFHAFLALISAALVVALLSDRIPLAEAIPMVTAGFGGMMEKIGILLIMAAIIGKCLMDSGAADRIVRGFTRLFGAGRENYSLLSSSFVLAIPVFFDTVFYLLAPLARAVYTRRKKDYVMIVCAAAAGGAITHALVPPTPGPIAVAEKFQEMNVPVTIFMTMLVGVLASIVPVFVGGVLYTNYINRKMTVIPKAMLGVSQEELEAIASKSDSELPNLFFSCLPFVLPVLLLAFSSIAAYITHNEMLLVWIRFAGDKNVAFFIGALIAIGLLISQMKLSFDAACERLGPAIGSGAIIAFITCAGGAFGSILAQSGIGTYIADAAKNWGLSLLVLAYLTSTLIRVAQGSATVAMITTAGIIAPSIGMVELGFHPVYLVCVIGFGASGFSWMNDSGFWIFSQLTGLNETQTLKTWTALLTIMSVTGFLWVWLLTRILPLQ